MTALTREARDIIRDSGLTIKTYTGGAWTGDTCGCPDDRCVGYHHDAAQDCRCLPAALRSIGADVPSWIA